MINAPSACPICKGRSIPIFMKHGYWINECDVCSHQFVDIAKIDSHVEQVYNDAYFTEGGAGYPNYLADEELLIKHGRRYASILSTVMQPGSLLDVGCAAGFIPLGFEEKGWKVNAVEPNKKMATYASQILGIEIYSGSLEDFQSLNKFDVVSLIQVLPHIIDIRASLEKLSGLTKPDGYWLIETWDRDSWFSRISGKSWHEYNPPSVLHWFTRQSLRKIVEEYGLVEIATGRPRKWISLKHVLSVLAYSRGGKISNVLSRAIGRLQASKLMLPYPGDDIFWALYRHTQASR